MKRNINFLTILTIGTILISGCSAVGLKSTPTSTPIPIVEASDSVISQGNLVPKEYMYLAFPIGGHVEEILVKQGDPVTAGQVLARMGDQEQYQANLTSAMLEVENAQQSLDELNQNAEIMSTNAWLALLDANQQVIQAENAWNKVDTDEYQKDIDDAEIEVSDAETALEDAQTEFDKYANLDPENPAYKAAEKDLNEAQDDYDKAVHTRDQLIIDRDRAQANLELAKALQVKAQSDYDATRQGPDPDKLTLAQMNLETAQAHQTAAQSALDNMEIKAPFDGTVVDVNIKPGELTGSDKWAVLVADFSEWYVETNDLTEQEVVKISLGQGAAISPDALPELHLSGVVTEIADNFSYQAGDILYKVRLRVEEPDPLLKWGMTVETTFNP
jgi:multidrug resistance efflux pump